MVIFDWPLVVLILSLAVVVCCRAELRALVRSARRVSAPGFELETGEQPRPELPPEAAVPIARRRLAPPRTAGVKAKERSVP